MLNTTINGRKINSTWLYFVCRNCGCVRKQMDGEWCDVDEEEWKMAQSNEVLHVEPIDEYDVGVISHKKPTKKSRRKNKTR